MCSLGPLVASLEAGGRLGHRADLDQALGSGLAFAFPAPRLEVVLAGLSWACLSCRDLICSSRLFTIETAPYMVCIIRMVI